MEGCQAFHAHSKLAHKASPVSLARCSRIKMGRSSQGDVGVVTEVKEEERSKNEGGVKITGELPSVVN